MIPYPDVDTDALVTKADALTRSRRRDAGFREGVRLYRRAFQLGDTTAAYNLACTYQNLGDYRTAVTWFRRALAAGDLSAELPLAQAELSGSGTRRNPKAALGRLERIARARGTEWFSQFDREQAMIALAAALRDGWVLRRDYPASLRWLRRAAKLGSAEAKGLLKDLGE